MAALISRSDVFPHPWQAEILSARPMILPSRHFVYPAEVEEVELGALEVLIRVEGAQPFLATCALGFRDPAAPTGVWACPDPDWLCAVSGGYAYLIDTVRPERFTMLRYRPVLGVIACLRDEDQDQGGGLLLFLGHQSILAWGRNGEAWESERLSWEGVTVRQTADGVVREDVLDGLGWDMRTDRELPFRLDLATGRRVW